MFRASQKAKRPLEIRKEPRFRALGFRCRVYTGFSVLGFRRWQNGGVVFAGFHQASEGSTEILYGFLSVP